MHSNDLRNPIGEQNIDKPMPVLFIGHGSPMNAITDNEFSRRWKQLATELPPPAAVLCISAHWLTEGTFVTAMPHPRTIHDFRGFSPELYDIKYPAPGNPQLAEEIQQIVTMTKVGLDFDWGLDHGTWSIIRNIYPNPAIPVLQLSIDYYKPAQYHYDLAKELASLRAKGVLIIGSGNMVHNLGMVDFDRLDEIGYGYDWALEMNEYLKRTIIARDHVSLIHYEKLGASAKLSIPTPDHYYPLIYILALANENEESSIFNDKAVGGSLTMTSVRFG